MDIVERLRDAFFVDFKGVKAIRISLSYDDVDEAADEIERLRKIVDRLSDWKEVNGVRVLMKDYYETEIERLREENQKQRERIIILNDMIQTEHEIIRVAALREGE